jgi:predicted CopG family antitoxin
MVNKKAQTKIIRVSRNSYDSLLFIKSQLETKDRSPKSFSDVVDYLVGKWCKKHDRRSR